MLKWSKVMINAARSRSGLSNRQVRLFGVAQEATVPYRLMRRRCGAGHCDVGSRARAEIQSYEEDMLGSDLRATWCRGGLLLIALSLGFACGTREDIPELGGAGDVCDSVRVCDVDFECSSAGACVDPDANQGSLGGPCYASGSCDVGLECRATDVCAEPLPADLDGSPALPSVAIHGPDQDLPFPISVDSDIETVRLFSVRDLRVRDVITTSYVDRESALPDVDFGSDYWIGVEGLNAAGDVVASGATAPFDLTPADRLGSDLRVHDATWDRWPCVYGGYWQQRGASDNARWRARRSQPDRACWERWLSHRWRCADGILERRCGGTDHPERDGHP